jgi:hypothetical protein
MKTAVPNVQNVSIARMSKIVTIHLRLRKEMNNLYAILDIFLI